MLVTVIILVGTLSPSEGLSKVNIWDYDKLAHFLMFAVWTFLFGLVQAIRKGPKPNLYSVFSLGLFYGLLIEILQFILPTNRSPELNDFIADALGSGFAILILKPVLNKLFKDKKS